jgi:hypothetical protein
LEDLTTQQTGSAEQVCAGAEFNTLEVVEDAFQRRAQDVDQESAEWERRLLRIQQEQDVEAH